MYGELLNMPSNFAHAFSLGDEDYNDQCKKLFSLNIVVVLTSVPLVNI